MHHRVETADLQVRDDTAGLLGPIAPVATAPAEVGVGELSGAPRGAVELLLLPLAFNTNTIISARRTAAH